MKVYIVIQHPTGVMGVYRTLEAARNVERAIAKTRATGIEGRVIESSGSTVVRFPRDITLYTIEQEVME